MDERETPVLYLYGEIASDNVAPIIGAIDESAYQGTLDLELHICSPGGATLYSWALIDTIRSYPKLRVTAIGRGMVGSAALDIFIACAYRMVTPSTLGLVHRARWDEPGSGRECLDLEDELGWLLWERRTTVGDRAAIKKLIGKRSRFLNAHKMLDLGICDEIVGDLDLVPIVWR